MRTHNCNELRKEHIGQTATIIGWVNTKRDHHGVIFIDVRDREGITQAVFRSEEDAEAAKHSHSLRQEDIVRVTGTVSERPEIEGQSTVNPNIQTGEIELVASSLEIINKSEVLPFQLDKELSNEDIRLKYRYLDLRRNPLKNNLQHFLQAIFLILFRYIYFSPQFLHFPVYLISLLSTGKLCLTEI